MLCQSQKIFVFQISNPEIITKNSAQLPENIESTYYHLLQDYPFSSNLGYY